jgi:Flp pilus assembly protein TadG
MIGRRLSGPDSNLRDDRSGTAAIEFAIVLPGLLTLAIGCYEAANLILADLKLGAAAETASDLVAQTRVNTVLQSSDFTNITNAETQVMTPFPTSGTKLQIAYASITYNTGSSVIDWRVEVNGDPNQRQQPPQQRERCQPRQRDGGIDRQRHRRANHLRLLLAGELRPAFVLHVIPSSSEPAALHELCADLPQHERCLPMTQIRMKKAIQLLGHCANAATASLRRLARRREGNVAMIVGLFAIPLVIAGGIATDVGRAYLVKVRLGPALDAAALAVGSETNQTAAQMSTDLQIILPLIIPRQRSATTSR